MTRTPTNIAVTPLDLSEIAAKATEAINDDPARYRLNPPKEGNTLAAEVWATWGIVETAEGVYLLNNEGGGPAEPLGDESAFFDLFYKTLDRDGKPVNFGVLPFASFEIDVHGLRALATGEPVNLAEFIRSFGSRLEQNYRVWLKALESAGQVAK